MSDSTLNRPTTPPRSATGSALPLTPEQVKQFELNRLRAKAQQREREASSSAGAGPSRINTNGKRNITSVESSNDNGKDDGGKNGKLQRDSRLGTYFEYDLSKMVNSKGGFLVGDGQEVDESLRRKELERERERETRSLEPPINLDPSKNPHCTECDTIDIDHIYKRTFGCLVCKRCINEKPERYSLLTKTEVKADYLLTDSELRANPLMPYLLKANPHKSTFANMMLFLRYQVEAFAWEKWGSEEGLDKEWEKRESEKKRVKGKKFEQGLKDLRRRTREGVWQKRRDEEHKHVFGEGGEGVQVCCECGFTIEFEEF